ncbi:hypothetical protein OJF2_35830 [Aquisphaera giovannonii]|uniref:Transmembrane protein n=1 Tax=Aquisphaera giovannonii TaxID=406548 RepID=A0A5B9W369_9BACT|nr:hypothetical protein [Aquisphaera giovannonii]QEH35038.1 hypothetical protein OJF2_35830 [Aquisphaera giovannonii]
MRASRRLVWATALAFLFSTPALAQKGRSSSSSRPSGGSSRPSGGSSRPSSGSSRPSGGSMFGGSKSSTSSKPPTAATGGKAATGAGGSMFGGSKPSTTPHADKPSTAGAGGSSKPPAGVKPGPASAENSTSSRPTSGGVSTKAQAQRREESRQAYITTQKATAPPRGEAVIGGRSVKVEASSPAVTQLRERPSTYIQPAVRRERFVQHVTVYHYAHPYDYYWSRPVGYGIGPYSVGFWWMMMEWNAERRAQWLYHNQARLSAEAYADAARDAEVQRRLAALEAQRVPRDANYVDPEFAADPTDQYDQNYVEAAYNPAAMPEQDRGTPAYPAAAQQSRGSGIGTLMLWITGVCGAAAVAYVFFNVRWGK